MATPRRAKKKAATFEDLCDLAADMNDVMGLDPAIEFDEDTDPEDLKIEIVNNCYSEDDSGDGDCQIYLTDEFTDESWATLKLLQVEAVDPDADEEEEEAPAKKAPAKKAPAKKAPAKKAAPKKKVVEPEEADEEEEDEPEPAPKKRPAKKRPAKKVVEPEEEDEEEGEEEDEPEPAPKKRPAPKRRAKKVVEEEEEEDEEEEEKPAPKKRPAKKKAASKPRYTRASAFAEAVAELEESVSLEDLADRADEIYCEKTDRESNLREAKWLQTHGINILVGLGLAEVADGDFHYKG